MRKLQNIISIFGNVIVRQGNQLVVRIESLRSLRASSTSALRSYASEPALGLRDDAWQGPYMTWVKPCVGTATCFASAMAAFFMQWAVVKQDQRRHQIMCHRTAA